MIFGDLDDPSENPLTSIPEVGGFQQWLGPRLAQHTPAESLTVGGSYRLFG